jgi:hypothetical protein
MDVDTSSYPKPQQSNFLDTASKLQQLEQQKIGIDTSKLKLINEQWGIAKRELSTLASKPDVNSNDVAASLNNLVKLKIVPPDMSAQFLKTMPTQSGPQLQDWIKQKILSGQSNADAVNFHYGPQPSLVDQGQQLVPMQASQNPAIGVRRLDTGARNQPLQTQIPPTATAVDENNQPRMMGPQAEQPVPRGPLPVGPINNSAINGQSANFGGKVAGATVENLPVAGSSASQVQNRFPGPSGPATGMPPMFEEGKRQLTEDQSNATARMMRAKPAIQALPLMQSKGFLSGPGTSQFTQAVAALKTLGLVSTDVENDPTAAYQEVTKKLAQYVSGSPVGQRSDAAQTLAEASSPNPKTQILPALIKLTKDAVILDRVEAARPTAFKDKDLSKYGSFRSTFPQSIDERAFGLDMDPPEKSVKLVDDMAKKLNSKNGRENAEANKFFKSLRIAKDQDFYR